MIIKPCEITTELLLYRFLHGRMEFSMEVLKNYKKLEKGFAGELIMNDWLNKHLTSDMHILNNLKFKVNNSTFQIDTLLISKMNLIPLEVKNVEGDYLQEGQDWLCAWNKEKISNPVEQLRRSERLLRQLLQQIGINIPIEPYLVFVNPEFWLYNSPDDRLIIYPGQIKRFITSKLNRKKGSLNESHMVLVERLLAMIIETDPYENLPSYTFAELKKGVQCPKCRSLMRFANRVSLGCSNIGCDYTESVEEGILRSIKEVRLLFPKMKITVKCLYEWCGGGISEEIIRRILRKNFKVVLSGRYSNYLVDELS